jgi:H+-transporting ATPase
VLSDAAEQPLRRVLAKLWAPVPWMLEAAIALQLALGKEVEAAIISALLIFNATLAYIQEGRAQATLAALKSRLALTAIVRRDSKWATIPAADLVTGDLTKLSLGAVVSADARLVSGEILVDQSMLTGESIPVEAGPGAAIYAGALVQRGEAVAEVTATGARSKYGRAAELVRTAHVVSTQQKAVLKVVRNLAYFNGTIIALLIVYALLTGLPLAEIIPLVLTAVLASIPVALPATFTLASALGARALARLNVLPTRLSAVDEAASMDVLCSDKTGTLTQNALGVAEVRPMPGFSAAQVLGIAALTSSDGGRDPLDAAIRAASAHTPSPDALVLATFTPFDPEKKYSAATAKDAQGASRDVLKGAYQVIAALAVPLPSAASAAHELELKGFRVLAVAMGKSGAMQLLGLIALSDPPREDSAALVAALNGLGVRTLMVTGDAPATAAGVAHAVGIVGNLCPPGPVPERLQPDSYAVFAGISPEDKFNIVKALQNGGHVVGMCGDGANDAPALRQAQFGIAVSTATDVARSAAGMVLTAPGLAGIVAAVREGRITFQRILTYTLNSVTKKVVQVLLLGVGLLVTGHAILTPALMVVVMLTGDFLGMAVTTDNVVPGSRPNRWDITRLSLAGVVMGIGELAFCSSLLLVGIYTFHYGLDALRTLTFVGLVFGNQATTYNNRERRRLWDSRPSKWLLVSSAADILIASSLAALGVGMTRLPLLQIAEMLALAVGFTFLMDLIKVPMFRRLQIG